MGIHIYDFNATILLLPKITTNIFHIEFQGFIQSSFAIPQS